MQLNNTSNNVSLDLKHSHMCRKHCRVRIGIRPIKANALSLSDPPLRKLLRFLPWSHPLLRDGWRYQNGWKISKRHLTLPPSLYFIFDCNFSKKGKKVQNLQYRILDRTWPPLPFGTFPKIQPFWWRYLSLTWQSLSRWSCTLCTCCVT